MISSSRSSLRKAASRALDRAVAASASTTTTTTTTRPYSSTPTCGDRIVIAVGGNALQRRGERLTIENMLKASADFAPTIVNLAKDHQLVLTHGNGPQVGELALERSAARILQVEAIRTLLEQCPEILPIACGGGGIPVSRIPSNPQTLQGVEAVIDKDRCGGKLANELDADGYIILTDGGGIWQNFGKPDAREMKLATPEYLLGKKAGKNFPGSMGPKIQAAIDFVQNSTKEGAWAAIGDLRDASKMFTNEEGTLIKKDVKVAEGVVWRENKVTASKMKLTKDQSKYG